jgi:hypothetical protein
MVHSTPVRKFSSTTHPNDASQANPSVPDLCMCDRSPKLCGLSLGKQSIRIRARMKYVHRSQDTGSGRIHKAACMRRLSSPSHMSAPWSPMSISCRPLYNPSLDNRLTASVARNIDHSYQCVRWDIVKKFLPVKHESLGIPVKGERKEISSRMAGRRKRLQFRYNGRNGRCNCGCPRHAPGFLRNYVSVEFEEPRGRNYGHSTALSSPWLLLGLPLFSSCCFFLAKVLIVLTAATMYK